MRKTLLPLFLTLLIAPVCSGQISSAGLVAHWSFNGHVLDSSGHAHHGTPTAISYTTGRNGAANTAAVFNGVSSYVSVPYAADLNVTNYSICAILKPTAFNTGTCQTSVILERVRTFSTSSSGFYGLQFSDNDYDLGDCNAVDTSRYVFTSNAGANVPGYASGQYMPTIRTNVWTSVVATFDGSAVRVFVDGVLKATRPGSAVIGANVEGIGIGTSPAQSSYRFTGLLDDLRLYNRVLADSEIAGYNIPPASTNVFQSGPSPDGLAIFPNPAQNSLTISAAGTSGSTLDVIDGYGRCVLTHALHTAKTTLDVSSLASGAYLLRISSDKGVRIARFVKL